MLDGLIRNPWPYLPVVNMRLGLIRTGVTEPRSVSVEHQWESQSGGWNCAGDCSVLLVRMTESLSSDPPHGIALPVAKRTLLVESSTTTPPPAQIPSPVETVS